VSEKDIGATLKDATHGKTKDKTTAIERKQRLETGAVNFRKQAKEIDSVQKSIVNISDLHGRADGNGI
jgi:hypothetical protein